MKLSAMTIAALLAAAAAHAEVPTYSAATCKRALADVEKDLAHCAQGRTIERSMPFAEAYYSLSVCYMQGDKDAGKEIGNLSERAQYIVGQAAGKARYGD